MVALDFPTLGSRTTITAAPGYGWEEKKTKTSWVEIQWTMKVGRGFKFGR